MADQPVKQAIGNPEPQYRELDRIPAGCAAFQSVSYKASPTNDRPDVPAEDTDMQRPSDEMLMAYADEALSPDQSAAIESYLATDDNARRLVEDLRASRRLATSAFAHTMQEAPPDRLTSAILNAPVSDGAIGSAVDNVIGFHRRTPPVRTWPRLGVAASLAATIALIVAGTGGYLAGRVLGPHGAGEPASGQLALGVIPLVSPFATMLETYPSGRRLLVGGSQRPGERIEAAIVATFKDGNGRPCREVELFAQATPDQAQSAGIACRGTDGRWAMVGAVKLRAIGAGATSAPGGPASSSGIKPSSATGADALEGVLQMLGAGDVVSAGEEQRLLSAGWN